MHGGTPIQYGPSDPVNVGVMMAEPGVTQDEGSDVKLECIMVVTRQEHSNLDGLVGDSTLDMVV